MFYRAKSRAHCSNTEGEHVYSAQYGTQHTLHAKMLATELYDGPYMFLHVADRPTVSPAGVGPQAGAQ